MNLGDPSSLRLEDCIDSTPPREKESGDQKGIFPTRQRTSGQKPKDKLNQQGLGEGV